MEKVERKYMLTFPESLEKVVRQNDFEFLRKIAAFEDEDECLKCLGSLEGNIFHFAAYEDNAEFVKEATKILPDRLLQSLLCQKQHEKRHRNPLHVAVFNGYSKIVNVILDYYKSQPDHESFEKPWLGLNIVKETPLHEALSTFNEEIALDMLSMDVELLCNMKNKNAETPICIAVKRGLNRFAVEILTHAPNCSLSLPDGCTVLFWAAFCSAQVCKMLVDKAPQLIIGRHEKEGHTVLHNWVGAGKLYPFEYVLNKNDIITPHLRKAFISQLATKQFSFGFNPLHLILASVNDDAFSVKIAQILVNAYMQEYMKEMRHDLHFDRPWLMEDKLGLTPLHKAIIFQREQLALYLFSLDSLKFLHRSVELCATKVDIDVDKNNLNLLLLAINKNCPKVAEEILRIILQNEEINTQFSNLITFKNGESAMSYAPQCTANFLGQLLETHPEFITQRFAGNTVLHQWIIMGKVWAIEHILTTEGINPQDKATFLHLFRCYGPKNKLPLHLAAASSMRKEMFDIIKVFHDVSNNIPRFIGLWSSKDNGNTTPLQIAISNTNEELAILFLSTDEKLNHVEKDIVFLAIDHKCHKVVEYLLKWSIQHEDQKFLKSTELGNNILHVVWKSTEKNGRTIVEKWPELINDNDKFGKTPLQIASEVGTDWLVKLILQQDRSSIEKTPLAWIEACNYGHISTVLAFVEHSPYFRSICRQYKDTPLHHIQNAEYNGYKQLLEHKFISEMKNAQNETGDTPLHLAIKSNNKELAEILLTTDDLDWNLKDNNKRRAKELLSEKCDNDDEWQSMCKLTGVHRTLKATYIEANTNVMEMRGTISVVATLLATITITAGFAVPGGIDSNGDAILSGTITFWVFVISNAYAMCCAILILFCNTWSMVSNNTRSSILLDRSLWLLKQSLYGTLVAFTLAMYTVIHKKSFWAAIVVAVMVFLVVVLAQRKVLYKILDILKYFEENPPQVKNKIMSLLSHASWNKRRAPLSAPDDIENQVGEVEDIATTSGVKKSS